MLSHPSNTFLSAPDRMFSRHDREILYPNLVQDDNH